MSATPFTDKIFQVTRHVTYFTLGNDQSLFDHFRELALSGTDSHRMFNATGIAAATGDGHIGIFDEPTAVCGRLYPKHTVAVFQGKWAGSRFALFSVDDGDAQQ